MANTLIMEKKQEKAGQLLFLARADLRW